MGKTIRNEKVKTPCKKRIRYFDNCECAGCRNYGGNKYGCKLNKCCHEDETLEDIVERRAKNKRGIT